MIAKVYPSYAKGHISLPSSKSEAHRAIIAACLAKGESVIRQITFSKDIEATISAMESLGAVLILGEDSVTVKSGVSPCAQQVNIDCGESGSTLRFVLALCLCMGQSARLYGSGRLPSRPQEVYADLCRQNGITFLQNDDYIEVSGKLSATSIDVDGGVSSQFITGLLIALPLCGQPCKIRITGSFESRPYVFLTCSVLQRFGVCWSFQGKDCLVLKQGSYTPQTYTVQKDASALAFFAVLGAIHGDVFCDDITKQNEQGDMIILQYLKLCGAEWEFKPGGLMVKQSPLSGVSLDICDYPDLGPILTVLAAFSGGFSITGTKRLKIKESDRAAAMAEELSKLAVAITVTEDTIVVGGRGTTPCDRMVSAHNDHRIAMSLAIFAACGESPVLIDGCESVEKSYPAFWSDLSKLDVKVEIYE